MSAIEGRARESGRERCSAGSSFVGSVGGGLKNRVNGALYVIDAGDGVARRLAEAGINIRDIGTVFTHHHDDHTAGLGTLMSVAWDQQK